MSKGKHQTTGKFATRVQRQFLVTMTIRISLCVLATLLFICVFAALSSSVNARTVLPSDEDLSSVRIMVTGSLNVVVFRVGGR